MKVGGGRIDYMVFNTLSPNNNKALSTPRSVRPSSTP